MVVWYENIRKCKMRNREVKKFRLKKRSICRDRDNDRKENKIEGFYCYL